MGATADVSSEISKSMRGDFTIKILEALQEQALASVDLLDVFLSAGYGASAGRMEFLAEQKRAEREVEKTQGNQTKVEYQRYYDILYRLKKQGFVEETKTEKKLLFWLSISGKEKLARLRKGQKDLVLVKKYEIHASDASTLIIFDIPELERRKRDWLRGVLMRLGFSLIQRSVWMGKVKIPAEFLEDLRELQLLSFIQIFEVSKAGSLDAR